MSMPLGGSVDTEASLTRTGVHLGTPRYRAPEQQAGNTIDEATDQFAFCVAMHEALHRVHPFVGTTARELRESIAAGRRAPVPGEPAVPSWLREVVSRGLAIDPKQRHPSMAALVAALAADPSRRRRRVLGAVAGGLLAVGAAGSWWALARAPAPCTDGPARLEGAWDAEQRERVVATVSAVPASYAAETSTRVANILDDYRQQWLAAYRDACEATRVHARQTEARLELRASCLDRHRRALAALADVLSETDASSLPLATRAALDLPPIDECADPDPERARLEAPSTSLAAAEAGELADAFARADALYRAGRYVGAREVADEVARRAEAAGWSSMYAEASFVIGRSDIELGEATRAMAALERAYHAADAAGNDGLRVLVAGKLIYASAVGEHAPEDPPWIEHGWAALRRQGGDPAFESVLHGSVGSLRRQQGRLELALEEHRRAIALAEDFGRDPMRIAVYHNEAGNDLAELGRAEEAIADYRATEDIVAELLGPAHPHVGLAHDNIAHALARLGRHDEALVEHRRALEILEPALGPEHISVAMCRGNIANALSKLGRPAESLLVHREVLATLSDTLGARHRLVAQAHGAIADDLEAMGDREGALEHSVAALDIHRAALPAGHPSIGEAHHEVARRYGLLARHAEALEHLRHAAGVFAEAEVPDAWRAHTHAQITVELALLALTPERPSP
jgi:eukaryotic-like serine/threonine-protein kinase